MYRRSANCYNGVYIKTVELGLVEVHAQWGNRQPRLQLLLPVQVEARQQQEIEEAEEALVLGAEQPGPAFEKSQKRRQLRDDAEDSQRPGHSLHGGKVEPRQVFFFGNNEENSAPSQQQLKRFEAFCWLYLKHCNGSIKFKVDFRTCGLENIKRNIVRV